MEKVKSFKFDIMKRKWASMTMKEAKHEIVGFWLIYIVKINILNLNDGCA